VLHKYPVYFAVLTRPSPLPKNHRWHLLLVVGVSVHRGMRLVFTVRFGLGLGMGKDVAMMIWGRSRCRGGGQMSYIQLSSRRSLSWIDGRPSSIKFSHTVEIYIPRRFLRSRLLTELRTCRVDCTFCESASVGENLPRSRYSLPTFTITMMAAHSYA